MPFSQKWKVPGTRVITPIGCGSVTRVSVGSRILVTLDSPWAGDKNVFQEPGEIVLDSDFTLLRILNVTNAGIIASAINYPTWEEVSDLALSWPFIQDETLIALNFLTYEAIYARVLNFPGSYHFIDSGYDRHLKVIPRYYDSKEEAIHNWEAKISYFSGTTGHLSLTVFIAFENDEFRILARMVLGTAMVLKNDIYYK